MNYITTDKHEFLRTGKVLKAIIAGETPFHYSDFSGLCFSKEILNVWLKDSWIVEQQKPEFTKDELMSFAAYWHIDKEIDMDKSFDGWLKSKGKEE